MKKVIKIVLVVLGILILTSAVIILSLVLACKFRFNGVTISLKPVQAF